MVTPPPPEHWPRPLRDDVERLLRDLAKQAHDGFAELQMRYRPDGVRVDWDQPGAREWLLARLLARVFPAWKGATWHKIEDEQGPSSTEVGVKMGSH